MGPPGGPPGMAAPGAASAQSVSVATLTKGDVPVTLTSLGTISSLATATVKSQISGYLTEIHFHEGQMVEKGELLVQIDPRPYEALLTQYQGQLEKDQALLDNARLDLQRYQRLIKQDSTSRQTVDTAAATVRQYEGLVRSDKGQVDTQKLNLVYCRIVSPVHGRVGLRQVDVGNYVTPSDTNGVVVVTQIDPISVVFTLPEESLRKLMKRLREGARPAVTVYDRAYAEKLATGVLDAVDNQIDTSTGTVKLRALFENANGALFPNQFVNVELLLDTQRDVVVAPATAIRSGAPGTFVYVVNSGDTVSVRKITTGASAGGNVAILSGLAPGDRLVVEGAERLSEGAKIRIPSQSARADRGRP
ncbi:MdtA/MuxA family multidrug efflux RND transporter periplasmic adaptor subunit [Methylosinus sp. C49]|uniref:MdtA/MuxA family multidrug efflux RND transporter periplasmic adaptor subunit n=1 Tax=Methylosinus sp. C49 TaxID=2699395 RepID=UPI001FCF1BBA|nr:MdtA/MuxA family multidrug efflux RND transporter periplasmic adaptor subunit [Methylosinus sp. C49]